MRIPLLLMIIMTSSNNYLFSQSDSTVFNMPEKYDTLETRKEKKQFRIELMNEFNKELGKHFNVPCNKCWYFTARAGYGLPFLTLRNEAPFDFLGNSIFVENAFGEISDVVNYGTAGRGVRFGLGFGKMFNSFIGFELFLNYNGYEEVTLGSIVSQKYSSELVATAHDLSLMPQLVLQSPNLNNIYIYSKLGAILPFNGYATINVDINDSKGVMIEELFKETPIYDLVKQIVGSNFTQNLLEDVNYNATIKAQTRAEFIGSDLLETLKTIIGFTAVAGMKYQISPIVSVTGELRYTGFHVSLASNRVEKLSGEFSIAGIVIPIDEDLLPYGKFNIDYVKELTEDSNNYNVNPTGYDPNIASEDLPYRTSTSVLSGNIGLQVNIPNKKQRATNKAARF